MALAAHSQLVLINTGPINPSSLSFPLHPQHSLPIELIQSFFDSTLAHSLVYSHLTLPLKKTIKMQFNFVAVSVAALVATAAASLNTTTTGNGYV